MELPVLGMFVILCLHWCGTSHTRQIESESLQRFTILGFRNGEIWSCIIFQLTCKIFYNGSSPVLATLVHGEYLFASHTNGEILKCHWDRNDCTLFHRADDRVTSLAATGGFLYAASNHIILRCKTSQPDSCSTAYTFEESVKGMYRHDKYIYAGANHNLLRCSGDKCQRVTSFDDGVISSVSSWGGNVITFLTNGTVWTLNSSLQVTQISLSRCFLIDDDSEITVVKGLSKYAIKQRKLEVCKLEGVGHYYWISGLTEHLTSVSITYATHKKIRNAITKCGQLGSSPVYSYQEEHRALMEVSVADGKLVDSRGAPVDTRTADVGSSGRAAVFVMGPGGQILLSKAHRSGLVDTSSFFSGPVAGAGEMIAEDGVVKRIVACSEHYGADVALNKQVVEELYSRGYTRAGEIALEECAYTCDRNEV